MSKMNITIPHHLPEQEAVSRIKKLLSGLQEEHKDMIKDLKEEWQGNTNKFSFSAKGFDLSGEIEVTPGNVSVSSKLPFMLSFFKDKIGDLIKKKAAEILA
jgi:hypothetical protein